MRVSASEIQTFLKCRRLWRYSGDSQMRLSPPLPAHALVLGSGIHHALEAFYHAPSAPPVEAFQQWTAAQFAQWRLDDVPYDDIKFGESFQTGEAMLEGYLARYGARPEDDPDMRVLASSDAAIIEQQFAVPIPDTDGFLVGRLDGLCHDREGRTWVLDHKSYTRAPTALHQNLQFLSYTWAANLLAEHGMLAHMGVTPATRIYGVLYNGLRKQRPGPRVTTPLFRREWVLKNRDELVIWGETLTAIYKEMANPAVGVYPTLSRECEYCDFQEPCYARQIGQDEQWLLAANYRQAPPRGEVYSE